MPLALLQAANTASAWNEEVIAKATITIAVINGLYLLANVLLWLTTRASVKLARQAFEATHRPFIGVVIGGREVSDNPPRIKIWLKLKNAGSAPANDVRMSFKVVADGNVIPTQLKEVTPSTIIIPGAVVTEYVNITDPKHYQSVLDARILSLLFECTYKGVTPKERVYKQKLNYDKEHDAFEGVEGTAT